MKSSVMSFVSKAALTASVCFGIFVLAAQAEQISVAGSTTVKPVVDAAVKEFAKNHANANFVVGAGGSSQGIQAIGRGEVQLGMSSRPMKDAEETNYSDLVATQIGTDGVALIVNKSNPVKSLTTDQVVGIFTGKITNWKDVGGNDAAIVLITPSKKHGTYDAFVEHFKLEGKENGDGIAFNAKNNSQSGPVAKAVDGSKPVLAAVMTQPNAISYVSLGSALAMNQKGAPIQSLQLDGVDATEANVLANTYKFQRPLLLLTKGAPSGTVKEFVDFTCSPQGQEIVKGLEYLPVTATTNNNAL